ncbi:PAS domain S-box protein [bacterium]|nr:PAS domain S-box protein [bacterium]
MATETATERIGSPAPSYAAHRQRAVAASFAAGIAVIMALTAAYAAVDLLRTPNAWDALTYGAELLIPPLALLLARGPARRHVEGVVLAADALFTLLLAGRLLIPTTTVSGTALFLVLKLVATALLFPWHPLFQYASAAATMLAYYLAMLISGRDFTDSHQLVGPLLGAVLGCVGATLGDRTRRRGWRQSVALAASDQQTRALLESERILVAIAREISVLSDLPTALDRINSLTATALQCDFSTTLLIDPQRRHAAVTASSASDPALRAQLLAIQTPLDTPLMREVLAGRSVLINDPDTQPWLPPADLARDRVQRMALTPIVAKGSVVGLLVVTRSRPDAPHFDERPLALLKAIAAHAAIAIENARLFDGLAASEASYRDLFERATDLIFVIDEHGGIRFANQAAIDFVGIAPDAITDMRWHQFVTTESRRLVQRRVDLARQRHRESERAFEVEVCPSGRPPATLEVRARRISPSGQPRVYQCIARDVTERRQHERESEQLLHRLREANRLQAEFVANMSHELRTPLNVIIGYADLLADEPNLPRDGDAPLFLDRIASAGRALHRLVESVLEYARLDRGRSVVIPRRFPAAALLNELRELGADLRGSADIAVRVQADADLVFYTDYDRLYSILSNLLLNAIKFTSQGEVVLAVQQVDFAAEFIVRDTGIGIDREELAHVFEPFRQVDGSPTRSFGGVGLGLAIVRRNTELLRGTVEAESVVGVGSTFRVRVPLIFGDAGLESSAA